MSSARLSAASCAEGEAGLPVILLPHSGSHALDGSPLFGEQSSERLPPNAGQVVLVEASDGAEHTPASGEPNSHVQNVQIILDINGSQILLSNEEPGYSIVQQCAFVQEEGRLTTDTQTAPLEDRQTESNSEQGEREKQANTAPVPVLFQVQTEDGVFHSVNVDVDGNQEIKTSNPSSQVSGKESEPAPAGGGDRPFQCDLCSATFSLLGNFTRHRMIHTIHIKDDYRYKCEECGRMFLQRCDLKRHMLIHQGNHPHKCDQCGKGYVRKSDLIVHKRFHNNERSFSCTQCSKAFFQSGDLQRHIRQVHQRIKPLTCGHCQRKYTKEATLIRHMQTVHRDIILKSLSNKIIPPLDQEKKDEDGRTEGASDSAEDAEGVPP